MKKPDMEFNLATMTEQKLFKMLDEHNAGTPELFALLEALFDMWSSSLRFSAAVVQYGAERHPNFLEDFAAEIGPQHGVPPEKLLQLIRAMRKGTAPSSTSLH